MKQKYVNVFITYGFLKCKLDTAMKLPEYNLCYNTRDLIKLIAENTSDCKHKAKLRLVRFGEESEVDFKYNPAEQDNT